MLYLALSNMEYTKVNIVLSYLFAFLLSILLIQLFKNNLPHDLGRDYALNGKLSKGKPRGAGLVFVIGFIIVSVLFVPLNRELIIYYILLLASMLTGFFDDKADKPWGELKKGLMDLVIAFAAAGTFMNFNREHIGFAWNGDFISIHPALYMILAVILIWASINVTNCADGVDGLSGNLSVITLATVVIMFFNSQRYIESHVTLLMVGSILGYLWYNTYPSEILMGDAGSRAIGFFIAIAVIKTYNPLFYLLVAFVLILDGGTGLLKIALLRFFKVHILKNVRTPLHDFARKTLKWSDSQVVFRFSMIQVIISAVAVLLLL